MHRWCLLNLTVQGFSLNLTVRGVSNKHCLLTFFILSVYFSCQHYFLLDVHFSLTYNTLLSLFFHVLYWLIKFFIIVSHVNLYRILLDRRQLKTVIRAN